MRKSIYWIIDYYYLLLGNMLMFVHKNPPGHYLDFVVKGKVPIILIPGISNKWGFLKHLGDSISHKGHPVYIARKLGFKNFITAGEVKTVREAIRFLAK